MRYSRTMQFLIGLLLILVWGVGTSHANMVAPPAFDLGHPLNLVALFLLFGATTIIEFYVIYWILGRPRKARKDLFLCALLVNALTNPLTQVAVWLLQSWFVIELVVVMVEFGFMIWVFKRMYHSEKLDRPITLVRTVVTVLVTNMVSFGLGVVGGIFLMAILPHRPIPAFMEPGL